MNFLIKKTFKDILSLKIQGATNVAKEIIKALGKCGEESRKSNLKDWKKELKKGANYLISARPTEPMAKNGVNYIFFQLKELRPKNISQAKNCLNKSIDDFLLAISDAADLIVNNGQNLIKNKDNIFTHCHSWLVEQVLIQAKKNQKNFQIFNTETRPLYQGRITAKKLLKEKIKTTMVADSSAGFLVSHYSGEDLMMDRVILGCDAILPDGSIINKIGSFTISFVAYEEKVPLYIATTLLKYHDKSWIKIEKRSPKEIWPKAPKNLKIINFAFDKIPAKYITGIICEQGIIKPAAVKKTVKKVYPFL